MIEGVYIVIFWFKKRIHKKNLELVIQVSTRKALVADKNNHVWSSVRFVRRFQPQTIGK